MENTQHYTDRIKEANKITKRKTIYAAGAGLIPFPIVDTATLLGVQLTMIQSIANLYKIEFKEHIAKSLIGSLMGSITSVGLIKIIPGIGSMLGGVTASVAGATSTYALGRVFTQHFDQGGTLLDFDPISSREYFQKEYEEGRLFVNQQNLIEQNEVNDTSNDESNKITKEQLIADNEQLQIMLLNLQRKVKSLKIQQTTATNQGESSQNNGPSAKAELIAENEQLEVDLLQLQQDIELLKNRAVEKEEANVVLTNVKSDSTISKVVDFTIIEGIGPKIDQALKAAGIDSIETLSKTEATEIEQILKEAKGNFNFADPTSWPQQATLIVNGKVEELKALQDELIGGRIKKK